MTTPTPTAPSPSIGERLHVLDVLRGIALLGMYVVHVQGYRPDSDADATGAAAVLEQVYSWFFDSRFFGIFGILFGVGFAVQLARADARGGRFVPRCLRRLAMLAIFGFIAEGIFGYNVLFSYAMWGVPLLLVRRWPLRWLVLLLVVSAASRPLTNVAKLSWYGREAGGIAAFMAEATARGQAFAVARSAHEATEKAPDWGTVIRGRLEFMPKFQRQFGVWPMSAFTLFLIGLIGWRLRLFQEPAAHSRTILLLMAFGVASWAVATWALPFGGPVPPTPVEDASILARLYTAARVNGLFLVRDQWLAITYIGAVLLLVAHRPVWLDRLAPFAWAGRMALTNYMMQIVLLDVLGSPHGFDLRVPPLLVPVVAIALFAGQAVFSRWWLATHAWGPLEWLWRTVTYWESQPFRRPSASQQLPSPA